MDFVGGSSSTSGIPVPKLELPPEILGKNCPLEFLLQPIIPLLTPPISEEPSFCLSLPGWQTLYAFFNASIDKSTLQMLGAGITASSIAYVSWKLSKKWNEGVDQKAIDPDTTEHLDDEVARIMAAARPEDITLTSACSSIVGHSLSKGEFTSNTSFFLERMSQDSMCTLGDMANNGPLRQLQSRIDQVMSRMEEVISGLKAFDVAKRDSSVCCNQSEDNNNTKKKSSIEVSLNDGMSIRKEAEMMKHLKQLGDSGQEIEKHSEDFQNGIRKLEAASEKIGKAIDGSSKSSASKTSSCNGAFSLVNGASAADSPFDPSPGNLTFTDTVALIAKQASPSDAVKLSPLRNSKRNIHSRNYNLRPFPPIEEHPDSCCADSGEFAESTEAGSTNVTHDSPSVVGNDRFVDAQLDTTSVDLTQRFDMAREAISGDSDVQVKKDGDDNKVDDDPSSKRYETWPLQSAKPSVEKSEVLSDRSSFTHSENSDFQILEPFHSELNCESFKFKPTKDAVDDSTSQLSTTTQQTVKSHNSPRNKQHSTPLRSNLYSFKNKSSPGKSTARHCLDRVLEEPEISSNEEFVSFGNTNRLVDIHTKKVFANTFNQKPDVENLSAKIKPETKSESCKEENNFPPRPTEASEESTQNPAVLELSPMSTAKLTIPSKTLKCSLTFDKTDTTKKQEGKNSETLNIPEIKTPETNDIKQETKNSETKQSKPQSHTSNADISVDLDSSDADPDSLRDNSKPTTSTTSLNRSSMRFITSPFKRNSKTKIADYQVKYVVGKRDANGSSGNIHINQSNTGVTNNNNVCGSDDEWIVITQSSK